METRARRALKMGWIFWDVAVLMFSRLIWRKKGKMSQAWWSCCLHLLPPHPYSHHHSVLSVLSRARAPTCFYIGLNAHTPGSKPGLSLSDFIKWHRLVWTISCASLRLVCTDLHPGASREKLSEETVHGKVQVKARLCYRNIIKVQIWSFRSTVRTWQWMSESQAWYHDTFWILTWLWLKGCTEDFLSGVWGPEPTPHPRLAEPFKGETLLSGFKH